MSVGADPGTNAVTGKRFIVSIDVEYLIEDEDAVHAAGSDSLGREGDLNERITQLVADRITGQALDLDRARVVGHSLTLPG